MERGHREMYQVRIGERGKYGAREGIYTARRGKTSFAREGWRGKGMNGDCRPRGRDEWPGTRGRNGGETRARGGRENPREEANEDAEEGSTEARDERLETGRAGGGEGGGGRGMNEGRLFHVDRRQSPSTVAGVPTG